MEARWGFSFHHFLVSFFSPSVTEKNWHSRAVLCVSTNPGKSPSTASIPVIVFSLTSGKFQSRGKASPTQHPLFAGFLSSLPRETVQGALAANLKTEPLGTLIHLTCRRRVTSWFSGRVTPLWLWGQSQAVYGPMYVGFCCPKSKRFPVTLTLSFIFAPSLACNVLVNDEGTAMLCPHIKSHLFTASGDLFLYLRFYWVWMDGFASLGIASRTHWW